MALPKYYKDILYTESERQAVTYILQRRAEESLNDKIKEVNVKLKLNSTDKAQRFLERGKQISKFELRNEKL